MENQEILRKVQELRELVLISKERPLDTGELNKMGQLRTELFGY